MLRECMSHAQQDSYLARFSSGYRSRHFCDALYPSQSFKNPKP